MSTLVKATHNSSGTIPSIDGQTDEVDFVTLASQTEGYSISDLGDLVNNALQQSMIRSAKEELDDVSYLDSDQDQVSAKNQQRVTMVDFEQAQAAFTPISLRGVTLQKSSVQWSDIGGQLLLSDTVGLS